jgi:preprotein translocase subunit YajC
MFSSDVNPDSLIVIAVFMLVFIAGYFFMRSRPSSKTWKKKRKKKL